MSDEIKEKVNEGKTIVEKRLKPSLIRRRAKPVEAAPLPEVQKEDEKPEVASGAQNETLLAEEKKTVSEIKDAKFEGPRIGPVGQVVDLNKRKEVIGSKGGESEKTEDQKKEDVERKPLIGVVGHISEVVPLVKESWQERQRRTKKRKSKEEIELESIQRAGGLKQFAGIVADDEVVEPIATPVSQERVFQPIPSSRRKKTLRKQFKKTEITIPKAIKKVIRIEDTISVSSLSQSMGIKSGELIKKLMDLGVMVTANQHINVETTMLLADEYGFKVEHTAFKEEEILAMPEANVSVDHLIGRPPVVTIMGHVDHGKTSLLDVIRETRVVDQEAGGITQHIGAYEVNLPNGKITFLDTPGHEAFTSMRSRGAEATDIAIIVVAADDGIMPQTIEAINHAKAAEVPIIIAINKTDLPNADPDRVKKSLTEHGLVPEEWGGDVICVPTSAKNKEGLDKLLEMILLQAEMLELKADPTRRAKGVIVEAKLDKARGPLATVLMQDGKLEIGSYVVCGTHSGKIKAMTDDKGTPCIVALPSKPVEIVGLSGVPEAGDFLIGVENDKNAKLVSEMRKQKFREQSLRKETRFSLDDLTDPQIEEAKELCIILKGDVQGSVEAVRDSIVKLATEKVSIRILHDAVGAINESDVILAKASKAIIVGFNVMPDQIAQSTAEREAIIIRTYRIIYELLDDVKKAMEGLLEPQLIEKIIGRAEVRNVFSVGKVGTVAGCMVVNGSILRNTKIRLVRNQSIVYDGKIGSLKRFKDDAKEVVEGHECGIALEGFKDIKVGDEIISYKIEHRAVKL